MKNKLIHRFVIGTFVSLYLLVSVISTIHVIDFFRLSNPYWLAVSLAIAFELGAAASLASLVILDKMNRTLVWMLFGAITLMQMQGNMYYAFVNMENFSGWSELFGLIEEDVIYQKRVLSAVSGAILPLVALGFIKSLVDYIKPESQSSVKEIDKIEEDSSVEEAKKEESQPEIKEDKFSYNQEELEEIKEWDVTLEDGLQEEPISEEIKEERDEDHELDLALNEMVKDIEVPSEDPINSPSDSVGGYYGDILIDGNGVVTEESEILPVNSNKKKGQISDDASKVFISPTRL